MKLNIHPKSREVTITCSCGNTFVTHSTMERDKLFLDVCSSCHPFYTGTQKLLDSGGRVDRFRQKYKLNDKTSEPKETAEVKAKGTAIEDKPSKVKAKPRKGKEEASGEKKAK